MTNIINITFIINFGNSPSYFKANIKAIPDCVRLTTLGNLAQAGRKQVGLTQKIGLRLKNSPNNKMQASVSGKSV